MRFRHILPVITAFAFAASACGDDGGTGPSDDKNSMSASLNGTSFQPPTIAVQGAYVAQQGVVTISGSHTSAGTTTMVTITLNGTDGPDTYQISPNFAGTFGQVTRLQGVDVNSQQTWTTVVAGGSGSVTFTKLDASGATGTFSFTANPAPGNAATGEMKVLSGKFNVKFAS
ncbi:MAG TPA: hypothetical protein PLL69_12635 [Gemmatimonadales bacterium]|nr:hypothetical protein [Gemmatimonadales bacterium]